MAREVKVLPTAAKAKTIQHLIQQLAESQLVVVGDYRGLSVAEIGRLRRQLRASQTALEVAKNTLVLRAAQEVGIEKGLENILKGPSALAFSRQPDVAVAAKALSDYARTSKAFVIKGGVLGRRVLDADQVQQLADLPPREVLLARVVGGMQAPIAGLVTVLGGTLRGLVTVLNARKDQLAAQQGG